MNEAVIVSYARTAQTRSRPKDPSRDWFGQVRADTLAAEVATEVIKRSGVDANDIDNCITFNMHGNCLIETVWCVTKNQAWVVDRVQVETVVSK